MRLDFLWRTCQANSKRAHYSVICAIHISGEHNSRYNTMNANPMAIISLTLSHPNAYFLCHLSMSVIIMAQNGSVM